jgi:hypothetical protein
MSVTRGQRRFAVDANSARGGVVVSVDPIAASIRVKPEQFHATPEDFIGRVVQFRNELHRTSHTIKSARRDGSELVLQVADDLRIGRARVETIEDDSTVITKTALLLARIYPGVTLSNAKFEPISRVSEVVDGKIKLATTLARSTRPAAGDDVWLINVGPGDRFSLPTITDTSR